MDSQTRTRISSIMVLCLICSPTAYCQERVTPKASRGGKELGQPWDQVPAGAKTLLPPEWPLPKTRSAWENGQRQETRRVVLKCLGKLPPRPKPIAVKVLSREDKGTYFLERFEFHNGADALVPGILLIPKNRNGKVPAIIGLHGHGCSRETICTDTDNSQCVGPMLVNKGYVVAAIDTYFCGDRSPRKIAGRSDRYRGENEHTTFKLHLWMGWSLWGMMLRDQQCLIDYLQTRPEVDPGKIGVTGMSMGGTGSWWLAAVDDRIQATVGVAGFTRYTQLIAHNGVRLHGVYYYVPEITRHFDTEAIYALVAPRPMLMLSGDRDRGLPLDGIKILESKLGSVYRLYDRADDFHSIVYRNTGHEYLPEMQTAMLAWFQKHLPVGK